jgi:hypothetical protein
MSVNFSILPPAGATHFTEDTLAGALKRAKMKLWGSLVKEQKCRAFYVKPGESRRIKSRLARRAKRKAARRQAIWEAAFDQ